MGSTPVLRVYQRGVPASMRLWTELLTTKPASTRGIDSQRGRSCNQSWSGTPRGRRSGVSAVGRQHEQGPASSRPVPGPTPSPERPLAPAGSTAGYIPTHPSGACPERDGDSNSQEASHSSALRRKRRDSSKKASTRSFSATIAFSNSRMILKQVWVGKGTEVGSELLSRGFRCGDGEGGGGSSAGLCCEQGNSSGFPLPLPSLKNPGPTGPSPGAVLPA